MASSPTDDDVPAEDARSSDPRSSDPLSGDPLSSERGATSDESPVSDSEGAGGRDGAKASARPAGSSSAEAARARRRRDRVSGMLILSVAFVASLSISWWAKVESTPELSQPPAPPTSAGVAGYPDRVDPVANLGLATTLTARAKLRGIVADAVRADGTVDVNQRGRVRYVFQSPAGEGPQPPREPDTLPRRLYCGKQAVEIGPPGIRAEADQAQVTCTPGSSEGLPEPRCTPQRLWQTAVARGIPTDRPARIEYYRSRVGPAWRFVVAGQSPVHRFALYGDCERVLSDEESIGVPY